MFAFSEEASLPGGANDASAPVRHVLRAIASETPESWRHDRWIKRVRPQIGEALDTLCREFVASGAIDRYLRARSRLADGVVIGLAHLARAMFAEDPRSLVPPLAVVAVGSYGRGMLPPSSPVGLLFVLPSASDRGHASAARIAAFHAEYMPRLGLPVEYALCAPPGAVHAACGGRPSEAAFADRRLVWGSEGLVLALDHVLDRAPFAFDWA